MEREITEFVSCQRPMLEYEIFIFAFLLNSQNFFSLLKLLFLYFYFIFFSGGANFSGRGGRNPQSGSRGKKQPVGRGQSTINNPRGGGNQLSTRPAQRRTAQTVQMNGNEGHNITTSGPAWQQSNGNSSSFLTGIKTERLIINRKAITRVIYNYYLSKGQFMPSIGNQFV